MNNPNARLTQLGGNVNVEYQPETVTEIQADGLVERVRENSVEQTAMLNAVPLAAQYEAAFAAQVEAKHDQAERIEERLECLIETQASSLQQVQNRPPGILALPVTRARWQQWVQTQLVTMQRLQSRLEVVREIKNGMGMYGSRIEELAGRKLRIEQPELASEWDCMQEAQRRHQALHRAKALSNKYDCKEGRGLRLSQAPDQ